MLLFIDTETTGLHNAQIIELAALLTDESGTPMGSMNILINHNQAVPHEATAIHGITTKMCEDAGIAPHVALDMFLELHSRCHTIVAHNVSFDMRMIFFALNGRMFTPQKTYCTMMNSVRPCGLLRKNGQSGKWPRLEEAYKILCGKDLVGYHRAMVDVKACKEIFFKLTQR